MAERVDDEARKDAYKGLYVVSILAIIASASYLFYKFYDKTYRFFHIRRMFIIFVMTAGDLFIALFSLIVYAKSIFEIRYRPGCSTQVCAEVYFKYYFPFVYAVGIVMLCVELAYRHKLVEYFSNREMGTVVLAGVPWIAGLVLILPLTMAEMNWDDCRFESNSDIRDRRRAMWWVSVVLPAVAAVVCCIVVKQVKFNIIPKGRFPGVAHGSLNTTVPQNVPASQQSEVREDVNQPEPNVYTYGDAPSQPQPMLPNPQPSDNQSAPPSYTDTVQQPAQIVTQDQLEATVEEQKKNNLIMSVVFFVMVIPFTLFNLGYILNDDAERLKPVPEAVLNDLFYWTFVVRSAVMPFLWTYYTSKERGMAGAYYTLAA